MTRNRTSSVSPGFFLYSRKSQDDKDRQVLSIPSQIDEMKGVAERRDLPIGEVISEARSAKVPGRPEFNAMMTRLEAGEAQGILCWKLDRLARNPVDCGRLIWAVREYGIRIVTPTQTFSHEDDNIILMYVEFGMAHKYVDDLGRAVKRGLHAKAQRGLYPGGARGGTHLGYMHDALQPKGLRGLIKDPDRFDLVRRIWDLMLTGGYSVLDILKIANEDWGLRTRSGNPLSRAAIYRLLANPLYFGRFEYPAGSGEWYTGVHEPMVTEAEFDSVQALVGSKGRSRRVAHTFAFTALIRCGECSAMVTAEEKYQLICPICRHKFAPRGKDRCPRCDTRLEELLRADRPVKPRLLHYVYYHCTKQKHPACTQRAIREEVLEAQLAHYLEEICRPVSLERWVLARLRRAHEEDAESQKTLVEARRKALSACVARLDSLVRLKTSPQNGDGALLSDEEYARQRSPLLREKATLEAALHSSETSPTRGLDLLEQIFAFARQAPGWLATKDPRIKRLILAVFATQDSNLTLSDRKLRIHAPKPFPFLEEMVAAFPPQNTGFEPARNRMKTNEKDAFASSRLAECGQRDGVRTCRDHEAFTTQVPRDDISPYGEIGSRFVKALRDWLIAAPETELVALRGRLSALFGRFQEQQSDLASSEAA